LSLPVDRVPEAAAWCRRDDLPGLHDPLLLLYVGLVVDALFGEMGPLFRALPHPVVLAGRVDRLVSSGGSTGRSAASGRAAVRGILTVIVLAGGAAAFGWALQFLCRTGVLGAAVEAFAVAVLIAQRSLFDHVARSRASADQGGLFAADWPSVSHIVGRDPMTASTGRRGARRDRKPRREFFRRRRGAGLLVSGAGLPGLFAYKMANTLDSMIGHKSPRYRAFGWAAARIRRSAEPGSGAD
jgi:adenosylcobinamide-phosphate synthase